MGDLGKQREIFADDSLAFIYIRSQCLARDAAANTIWIVIAIFFMMLMTRSMSYLANKIMFVGEERKQRQANAR
jgi:hypothetical protein